MALIISEAMNRYASDLLLPHFGSVLGCSHQKEHFPLVKTVNGHAIYCVNVKRCRRCRNNADPVRSGISKTRQENRQI